MFVPSSAHVGVYFKRRRSLALGMTLSGISIGALLFPIGIFSSSVTRQIHVSYYIQQC